MSSTAAETLVIGRPPRKDRIFLPSKVQPSGDVPLKGVATTATVVPKTVGSGIYFTAGAILHITVWNSVTAQSLTFQCWYLDPQGKLKQVPSSGSGGLNDMSPPATRVSQKQLVNLPLTGGTIVSFAVRLGQLGTATRRGQTLVKASIDNTGNGTDLVSTTDVIVYGYVYTRKDLCYPGSDSIQDPVSGIGYSYQASTSGTAGVELSVTTPTNTRQRLKSVTFALTTDSNVANRTAYLQILDNASANVYITLPTPNMTSSATWTVFLAPGFPLSMEAAFDANKFIRGYLPPELLLLAASTFATTSTNLKAGDVWTVTPYVEEYIEPSS